MGFWKNFLEFVGIDEEKKRLDEKKKTKNLTKKFIKVYFKVNLSKKFSKKRVEKIALELLLILVNTKGIFNEKNRGVATVNPYLKQNNFAYPTYDDKIQIITRGLSKVFSLRIKRESNGDSSVYIYPINNKEKKELYSFLTFSQDLGLLMEINKYFIMFLKLEERGFLFNPIFINKKPAIQNKIGLLRIEYGIEDRVKYGYSYPEFYKLLGADVGELFRIVESREFKEENIKLTKKEKENMGRWIKEVRKLVD